jgi:hypothetical protein
LQLVLELRDQTCQFAMEFAVLSLEISRTLSQGRGLSACVGLALRQLLLDLRDEALQFADLPLQIGSPMVLRVRQILLLLLGGVRRPRAPRRAQRPGRYRERYGEENCQQYVPHISPNDVKMAASGVSGSGPRWQPASCGNLPHCEPLNRRDENPATSRGRQGHRG